MGTANEGQTVLDQAEVLKQTSKEESELLRDSLKYGYSKDVMSVNLLLDQSLESFVKLNNGIDIGASHRFENYTEVSS